MKIKKIILSMLMFTLIVSSTAFALTSGTLTVTATKSSGVVETYEKITYSCTTTSKDTGVYTVSSKISDSNTGEVLSTFSDTNTESAGTTTYDVTLYMPNVAHSNIKVELTFADKLGKEAKATYNYTMDATQKFNVTSDPADGSTINVGSQIELTATTGLSGVGLGRVSYVMYDGSNNQIATNSIVPDDKGFGVGVNKFEWKINGPSKYYSNVRLVVTLTDIRNATASKTFNYTVAQPNATLTTSVYTSSDVIIANGSTVGAGQTSYVRVMSDNESVGVRTFSIKLTNTSTSTTYLNDTVSSSKTLGARPLKYNFTFPSVSGNYKLETTAIDIYGKSTSASFNFVVNSSVQADNSNILTLTTDVASGSTINSGSIVTFTSTSSNNRVGTKEMILKIYNNTTNTLVATKTATSSNATVGSNPFNYELKFTTAGISYRIDVTATDINGTTKTGTYYYTTKSTTTTTEPSTNETVSVSFSPSTGRTVEEGDEITISGISSDSTKGIKTISYVMYNANGTQIGTNTVTSSRSNGNTPLTIDATVPNVSTSTITITATATSINGVTATSTARYTVDDDDDDDDDDDKIYEGVISKEGDDLVVDLWTVEKTKFFELEEDIEFVAYYYNYESKNKEKVVLEIEVPDDFDIVKVTTDQGTVTKKTNGDIIRVSLGTVESKELGMVKFTLQATDDDVCEEITEVKAIIYSDTDDEEDSSTQLIWIYDDGDRGTRKAFITGYTDGTFRPDNAITREEAAAMLARAFGYTATSTSRTFSDVKTTSWSYKYVAGCANKGIITGYTDGTFRPYNNITRAELYAMTFRALNIDTDDEKALFVPKEYKNDSTWETSYIAGLARLRMLEDMDDTDADQYATRAEVVYLISRVQFRNTTSFSAGYYSDVYSSYWCSKDIEAASVDYSYKRGSKGKEIVY